MCLDKTDLTAFIDESGRITKTDIEHHQFYNCNSVYKEFKKNKKIFQKRNCFIDAK